MAALVIPAILAQSAQEFRAKLTIAERLAPLVHIDVMDGRFVPNRAWADPRVIARMRTRARFEVHLMVTEPLRHIAAWAKVRRVETIIVHAETRNAAAALARIHAAGKRAGIAVNPTTPLSRIPSFLLSPRVPLPPNPPSPLRGEGGEEGIKNNRVHEVLLMANAPGFSGRPFRTATLARIRTLRRTFPRLVIGVDIGVNLHTVPRIARAGATYGAAGSAIFDAPDPAAAYRAIRRAFLRPPHARS